VRDVPWGLRVPLEIALDLGRAVFTKRCFGLLPESFVALPVAGDARIRRLGRNELERFIAAEVMAYGDSPALVRSWVEPVFGRNDFEHWIAEGTGGHVGTATVVWSDDRAGPAAMLTGVAATGDGAEMILQLLRTLILRIFERRAGALVHCHADSLEEAELLRVLGFVEVPGLLVRVVRDS
jgi:hypothetical protein